MPIPDDITTNENCNWAQFMVTTFYGPLFMLSKVCQSHSKKKKQVTAQFSAIFLSFSQEILKVHLEYGMILPVSVMIESVCPQVYNLLIPDENHMTEMLSYAQTNWAKRQSVSNGLGWSNFPLMIWLIGYLIQEGLVSVVDKGMLSDLMADQGIEFQVGTWRLTLSKMINYILFDLLANDNVNGLAKRINEKVTCATKETFYYDLVHFFELDGLGARLGGTYESPKKGSRKRKEINELNATIGRGRPTSPTANIGVGIVTTISQPSLEMKSGSVAKPAIILRRTEAVSRQQEVLLKKQQDQQERHQEQQQPHLKRRRTQAQEPQHTRTWQTPERDKRSKARKTKSITTEWEEFSQQEEYDILYAEAPPGMQAAIQDVKNDEDKFGVLSDEGLMGVLKDDFDTATTNNSTALFGTSDLDEKSIPGAENTPGELDEKSHESTHKELEFATDSNEQHHCPDASSMVPEVSVDFSSATEKIGEQTVLSCMLVVQCLKNVCTI
jgi:hypothetical protein